MAKQFFPFDSGDGSAVRTAQWSAMMRAAIASGVVKDSLNQLQVYADSTGMQIKIKSGMALIMGHYYSNDSEEILAIDASHATLARWDIVALQVDWTASNNQISTVIVKGTASASPALPALTKTTSKWQIPLAKIVVAAASITVAAGAVTDMRSFMGGTSGVAGDNSTWVNKSGIQLINGMVVVNDPNNDNAVRTTTIEGDQSACGIVDGVIDNDASGTIIKSGRHIVLVVGNVTRGHRLIPSTTPGYAKDSGYTQKNGADLGCAKTSFTGSVGAVEADLDIHPTNGVNSLSLVTQSTFTMTGSGSTLVTVQNGVDLLLVIVASKRASSTCIPTAMTLDSVAIELLNNEIQYSTNFHGITIADLRLPAIGVGKTLSITAPSGSVLTGLILQYVGSQPTPLRTRASASLAGGATSIAASPESVLNDLIIDCLCAATQTPWTQSAGQTIISQNVSQAPQLAVSVKPGAAGSTPMGWSGASSMGVYSAVAIKGA